MCHTNPSLTNSALRVTSPVPVASLIHNFSRSKGDGPVGPQSWSRSFLSMVTVVEERGPIVVFTETEPSSCQLCDSPFVLQL